MATQATPAGATRRSFHDDGTITDARTHNDGKGQSITLDSAGNAFYGEAQIIRSATNCRIPSTRHLDTIIYQGQQPAAYSLLPLAVDVSGLRRAVRQRACSPYPHSRA